jgi:hypothetical protein
MNKHDNEEKIRDLADRSFLPDELKEKYKDSFQLRQNRLKYSYKAEK